MDTTTLSVVEIRSSLKDHWWWHETDYVVHCTRHKQRCAKDNQMQLWKLEAHQGIIGGGTRQIMLFNVQDIRKGVWRTTKCS